MTRMAFGFCKTLSVWLYALWEALVESKMPILQGAGILTIRKHIRKNTSLGGKA